jgi:predicted secreted protein
MDADGNSEAIVSWGDEFFLADKDGTLVELEEVTELPFGDEASEDVEVTHMKSPGKRKEYKSGMVESGTATLTMNYVPGSASDVLIREAHASGKPRAYREILTDGNGKKIWQIDGFLLVKSRPRTVTVGTKKQMQVNVRFTGLMTEKAPVA